MEQSEDRRFRFEYSPLWEFCLRIGILFGFCGGALLISDQLKPIYGLWPVFIVLFAPFLMVMVGIFVLSESSLTPRGRVMVQIGFVGIAVIFAFNAYALWFFARGGQHLSRGLILIGIVVGTLGSLAYATVARRKLAAFRATELMSGEPIE